MNENVRQYTVTTLVTAVVVLALFQYEIMQDGTIGLSNLNHSFSTSTFILLGVVLLLGPLSRMFDIFDRFLLYRKELGMITFITGFLHVFMSMFVLARRGPFGFYIAQPLSAYSGLIALVLMGIIFLYSFSKFEHSLAPHTWLKLQYWGARISFVAILFHITILKYSGWITWFTTRDPSTPPIALLASIFALFVLLVRVSEYFGERQGARLTKAGFFAWSVFTLWIFLS